MNFTSTIDLNTDIETLFDKKNRVVAVYEKGKCKKVIDRLSFNCFAGYYLSKDNYYFKYKDKLVTAVSEDLNITRVCKNKYEYLRACSELKYHKLSESIFNDPYKEKEWRIKYNSQIELLEKRGIHWLLDKKSVLELNENDFKKFIKDYCYEASNSVKDALLAFKKGFKKVRDYKKSRYIDIVSNELKLEKKDATYFLKRYFYSNYHDDVRVLKTIIKQYKDILNLAQDLGINNVGFPRNLRLYELDLIDLKNRMDLKKLSNRTIKPVKNINILLTNKKMKQYKVEVLKSPRRFKEIADEFHNCIYTNYLKDVEDGVYIIGLIKKDGENYACVGFKDGKVDQLYLEYNKPLPEEEYKKLKRSLKVVRI